jgi:hypothetical protein
MEKGDKLGVCVCEGRWIGFDENSKGCRIYWPETRSVTVERNIHTRNDDSPIDCLEGQNWTFEPTDHLVEQTAEVLKQAVPTLANPLTTALPAMLKDCPDPPQTLDRLL